MPRAEEGRFDDLISVADVERLVSSGGLRSPAFRLVKEGGPVGFRVRDRAALAAAAFTGRGPGAGRGRVRGRCDDRAPGAAPNWSPLATFCRALEMELGTGTGERVLHAARLAGLRRPPRHTRRLRAPGRRREALAVYDPLLELPLKRQRGPRALGSPGPTVLELTLRAGDTLYLPRGWLHDALTSETDSLHITVGINLHTWIDAFRVALDECGDDVEFRSSVPTDGEPPSDLIERLTERLCAEDVRRRARANSSGADGRSSTGISKRSASSTRSRSTRLSSAGRR